MFNMSLWIVCFPHHLLPSLDLLLPYLLLPLALCLSSTSSLLILTAPTPTHPSHTISHTPPHLPHKPQRKKLPRRQQIPRSSSGFLQSDRRKPDPQGNRALSTPRQAGKGETGVSGGDGRDATCC